MRRSERRHPTAIWWRRRALPLLLAIAQLAGSARAQDASGAAASTPTQLTSRGRLVGSGTIGGSWTGHGSLPAARQSWRLHASPALIYFLRDRMGLGLTFGGSISKSRVGDPSLLSYRESDLFIGLLAAFDLPLSDQLSLLVQPGFHYVNQWHESSPSGAAPTASTFPGSLRMQIVRPALGLQLVLRISPHIGLSFGPDFWADIIVDDGGLRGIQAMLTDVKQTYVRAQLGLSAGLLLSF
jgi:hypothetical protein